MNDNPIDRLFDALTAGDVDLARAVCSPDARVWHSYDGIALTIDETVVQWQGMIDHSTARRVADVRRRAISDGFVQQHMFVLETIAGAKAWPVCIVVRIDHDRIARLDEYIDRAGSFPVQCDAVRTPGM